MFSVKKCPVPANTLLEKYAIPGAYVDCYWTEIPGQVSFPEFLFAFYTTWLFRLERLILTLIVSKASTEEQVRLLAAGNLQSFAAWEVEGRNEDELLLCDFRGRTRSWLMIVPINNAQTRLYFGSAVVPIRNPKTGKLSLGLGYHALLGFHKVYSVLLLYSAKSSIQHRSQQPITG